MTYRAVKELDGRYKVPKLGFEGEYSSGDLRPRIIVVNLNSGNGVVKRFGLIPIRGQEVSQRGLESKTGGVVNSGAILDFYVGRRGFSLTPESVIKRRVGRREGVDDIKIVSGDVETGENAGLRMTYKLGKAKLGKKAKPKGKNIEDNGSLKKVA
jgi:hypothetical protein